MADSGPALSFFRVFDIAFFLPGGFLCAVLSQCTVWPFSDSGGAKLETVGGISYIVSGVAAAFVIGLLVHQVQRAAWDLLAKFDWVKKLLHGEMRHKAWYRNLESAQRAELAMYFWYLRAATRNLALSSLLVLLAFPWLEPRSHVPLAPFFNPCVAIPLMVVLAALFARLGADYDSALQSAVGDLPKVTLDDGSG